MDKNISKQINELVADNRLEEALDMIIQTEQSSNQERHNTLLLLKGKLDMLEEQELAGLLSFEEVARQKARIAHAILRMTNDKTAAPPIAMPSRSDLENAREKNRSGASPVLRYVLFGLVGVAVLLGVFYLIEPAPENPTVVPADKQTTVNEPATEPAQPSEQPATPPAKDRPAEKIADPRLIRRDQISDLIKDPVKELSNTQLKDVVQLNDATKNIKTTPVIPVAPVAQPQLQNFPTLNRPFNFSDIRYTFTGADLARQSDGQLKLTLQMDLTCRNNLGFCEREEVLIFVDGQAVRPVSQKLNRSALQNGTNASDELVFLFAADAGSYRIQLLKNRSDWTRGFKILP